MRNIHRLNGILSMIYVISMSCSNSKSNTNHTINCDTLFYSDGSIKRTIECTNDTRHGWEYNYLENGNIDFVQYYNNGILYEKVEFWETMIGGLFIESEDTSIRQTQAYKRYSYFRDQKYYGFLVDYNEKSVPWKATGSSIAGLSSRFPANDSKSVVSCILQFAEPPWLDSDLEWVVYSSDNQICEIEDVKKNVFDRNIRVLEISVKHCKNPSKIKVIHSLTSEKYNIYYRDSLETEILPF